MGWADKLQGLTTKMMGQHLSGTEDVPDQKGVLMNACIFCFWFEMQESLCLLPVTTR